MGSSLENDMVCLLESIQCLGNDKSQIIQALEHLAEMVLQDEGATIFYKLNGISLIHKLAFQKKTTSSIVQKALILLGNSSLSNYENKNALCNDQIMDYLKNKIFGDPPNSKMIASGSYFIACLCSANDKVQNKARNSKLLDKLVLLYRSFHPKGEIQNNVSKEQWFEKASSNCPVVLTHISHALKSLMNKPRNVENQIVCSRLLNLALSTLASGKYAEDARIEALQFIADCLYENEKTQNIFNMIGGMRILSQVLKTEMKNECDNKAKRNLELTKTLLDTVTV
eukprot:TCONS_00011348-protein